MTAPRNLVLRGDCVEVMRTLPADSIDAVVTDPPYGIDFMGKEWDGFGTPHGFQTWTEQWAREAFRVLKPGGHLLAFGGTRMYHRLATGVEDAGFEVRDMMSWLYGSGFPKSLDVSKAMDKRRNDRGALLAVTAWLNREVKRAGISYAEILRHFGFNAGSGMVGHWVAMSAGAQPACPTWPQWLALKSLLGFGDEMDATVRELNGLAAQANVAWAEREVVGVAAGNLLAVAPGQNNDRSAVTLDITAPATDDAKRWEGWGTALKPAQEPIVVARKPLIGTVAENVLAHGTGAINIDASRIGLANDDNIFAKNPHTKNFAGPGFAQGGAGSGYQVPSGRWPANILFDEAAAAELDAQAPGASRFFYVAKPGKKERNAGLDGFREASGGFATRYCSACGKNIPRAGSCGCVAPAEIHPAQPQPNIHPTVKPIALMGYLIKLVTPPGGVVLDPFIGSGTTGCAAVANGFDYLGIEQSPEYADIAEARIAHYTKEEDNG